MREVVLLLAAMSVTGCDDFVDADGNTSIRQVAEGLQTLGDRMGEMGEALARDADIESVPWEELADVLPRRVDGERRLEVEGDAALDRNGAGLTVAHGHFLVDGDSAFVGVADLGALRGGARLALKWIAPVVARDDLDGEVEEVVIEGNPAIRIRDRDGDGVFIAVLVAGRFTVFGGAEDQRLEGFVGEALREVDRRQLERWEDYGVR
ncbi:MAG: hypothetical protein AAF389_14220 [Gemmatimonadota bacterium]